MKFTRIHTVGLSAAATVGLAALMSLPAAAIAATASTSNTSTTSTTSTTSASSASSASSQKRLQDIINRGNSEISRRLTTLGDLSSKISSATKLSPSDQSYLESEVSTEVSGLTALKTKLDAETTVAAAITDAQNVFSEYRVYFLVVPKVDLIKTADDQQVTEGKLNVLASKIQADINADKTAGKDVANLQTALGTMNGKISAAQNLSSSIETSVLPLTPTDYNNDHSVLTGDRNQLKTAQTDIVAALSDGKTLVAELKTLK